MDIFVELEGVRYNLNELKNCTRCKLVKPKTAFYNHSQTSDGKRGTCIPCVKETEKEYMSKNIDRKRSWRLTHYYGITKDEQQELFDRAGHKCELCESTTRLGIDHNHTTGKVRGLLCQTCNSLLGYAKDDIELLQRAIDYLKRS